MLTALLVSFSATAEVKMEGQFIQGGLAFGRVQPGSTVKLGGEAVAVSKNGTFVIGFGRNAKPVTSLEIVQPGGRAEMRALVIGAREYDIQKIEGLPARKVTPKPEDVARIKDDNYKIGEVRASTTEADDFIKGFQWPVTGPISGVYGSQRVLNGKPKNPHNGVDIAAPAGTLIHAPAAGVVALAHEDMFYTGKTMMIDHGMGVATVYAHMNKIMVKPGQRVLKGDVIGRVGNTGRTTGPHLHWGLTWRFIHLDPMLLTGPMPK